MENPNPSRNPAREPGTGNDDDGMDPRRTRENEDDDRTKRQIPAPNQRPENTPKTA